MPESMKGWQFDTKIPLGVILALLVQTVGVVWWASSLHATVTEHSAKLERIAITERERQRDERRLIREVAQLHSQIGGLQEDTRRTRQLVEQMHTAVRSHLGARP